jgi:hypothetical protein
VMKSIHKFLYYNRNNFEIYKRDIITSVEFTRAFLGDVSNSPNGQMVLFKIFSSIQVSIISMPLSFNILYKHGMMETDIRMFVPLRLLPA